MPPFGAVDVEGGGFPVGASITLTWESPHGDIQSVTAGSDGKFSASVVYTGRSGWQTISAVDGAGNRVTGAVNIP